MIFLEREDEEIIPHDQKDHVERNWYKIQQNIDINSDLLGRLRSKRLINQDLIQHINKASGDFEKVSILLNPIMKGSMANLRTFVDTLYETEPPQGHVAGLFELKSPRSAGKLWYPPTFTMLMAIYYDV